MAARLEPGKTVYLVGVVGEATTGRTRSGELFVRARLQLDNGTTVRCVWWDARAAPRFGSRVRVRGEVRVYEGEAEVHVRETLRLPEATQGELEHRLLRFYVACLEAERMRETDFPLEEAGRRFVLLEEGQEALLTGEGVWVELPGIPEVSRWLAKRLLAGRSEQVFAGYPVVVGERGDDGSSGRVLSPLFYVPVEIERAGPERFRALPESAFPELNVFALELLGLSREERIGLVAAVGELEEIASAPSGLARMEAWLKVLVAEGLVAPGFRLAPEHLGPVGDGVSNTAVLYAAERGPIIRNLVEDLEELAGLPASELRRGPLGILFGAGTAPPAPPAEPHPTVVPSNLSQDQAVTAALTCPFTVVTGPPGTGKSQVLVNAVAAALARGERVLFASKNNQAVDVVFQRLAAVSVEAAPLRAGARRYLGDLADQMRRALARPKRDADTASAFGEWRLVEGELVPIYQAARERQAAEEELAREQSRYERLVRDAPRGAFALREPEGAAGAAQEVLGLLRVASSRRPFWPWARRRWRAARAALPAAWERLRDAVAGAVPLPEAPDAGAAAACLDVARAAQELAAQRQRIEAVRRRLASLPDRWALHDRLAELQERRLLAGRQLFDALWRKLVCDAAPDRRAAAMMFAEGLSKAAREGGSVRRLLPLLPGVLDVFPVWGLTNLSARTNLPLAAGLFDLVIIDEASQCDVPSAIPLLYRARRALIIGDPRQLIHVTSLTEQAEQALASRFGLSPAEHLAYSYRERSLFALAAGRVGEAPLFLDQHFRSHPAIITFSNDHFYGSRLVILTEEGQADREPAVQWVHVTGEFRRGPGGRSVVNPPEAEAVAEQVEALWGQARGARLTLGVVTPYRAHAEVIRELVLRRIPDAVESLVVATAHRFQGDERDIIIFSPVVSGAMPAYHVAFASDPNLVNVAVTRARRRLVIVGDRQACLASPGVLQDLARYVTDLEQGGFRSPLERRLFEALVAAGVPARVGLEVEGYRLDLAVLAGRRRIDVECDGAAFHRNLRSDAIRDERLRRAGWMVVRFSGREIQRDVDGCVRRILHLLERHEAP